MKILLFLTDRFPYGKGESFIENEIEYLNEAFDEIIIFPQALTADTSYCRELPKKFRIMSPANNDDLYSNGRPNNIKRLKWTLKYMVPWVLSFSLSKSFINELKELKSEQKVTLKKIIAIIRAGAPLKRNVRHFSKQTQGVDINDSDEVYIYSYWTSASVYLVDRYFKNKLIVKKRIVRSHGHDLYNERRTCGYIPFRKNILRNIDKMYLISLDGLKYMQSHYLEFFDKYALSYLGTKDYDIIDYADKCEEMVIASCSYLIPIKRVNRIIDALSKICKYKIRWIHFGGGQDLDETVKYAGIKLGSKNNIKYEFMGHIDNSKLMKYYSENRVDLFINVSESEGLPVSIMEALSFGIPIIGTNVGSTYETIENNKNGVLIPEDFSDDELRKVIIKYCEMCSNEYVNQRISSRSIWEKNFSAAKNYSAFVDELLK